jgi:hypothetical protein
MLDNLSENTTEIYQDKYDSILSKKVFYGINASIVTKERSKSEKVKKNMRGNETVQGVDLEDEKEEDI